LNSSSADACPPRGADTRDVLLSSDLRFVLALGDDAARIEDDERVNVLRRVRNVVLAEADALHAPRLALSGEYVHVYHDRDEAFRAFSVFEYGLQMKHEEPGRSL